MKSFRSPLCVRPSQVVQVSENGHRRARANTRKPSRLSSLPSKSLYINSLQRVHVWRGRCSTYCVFAHQVSVKLERGVTMSGLILDVRYAMRQLRKSPGFTVAAMLMLALGICANGTVFSWINSTMLHSIPGASHTGDLVSLMRGERSDSPSPPFSYLDYRDLRDSNHTFTGILAYHSDWVSLTGGDAPMRAYGANVSASYFDVLGIK